MNDIDTDFGSALNRVNAFIEAFKIQHKELDDVARAFDHDDWNWDTPRDLLISDLEYLSSRAQVAPVKELVEQLRILGILSPGTLLHMPGDFRTEDVQQITELLAKVAGHPNLAIITVPEVSMVDEATMNAAGWFRKPF